MGDVGVCRIRFLRILDNEYLRDLFKVIKDLKEGIEIIIIVYDIMGDRVEGRNDKLRKSINDFSIMVEWGVFLVFFF